MMRNHNNESQSPAVPAQVGAKKQKRDLQRLRSDATYHISSPGSDAIVSCCGNAYRQYDTCDSADGVW